MSQNKDKNHNKKRSKTMFNDSLKVALEELLKRPTGAPKSTDEAKTPTSPKDPAKS